MGALSPAPAAAPWLVNIGHQPRAAMRLFCIPYAGGSSSAFSAWRPLLPASIDLWAVELPGRGSRWEEAPCGSIEEIRDKLGPILLEHIDRPFALFGHSMGALLAFELGLWLRARNARPPSRLILSGCNPPHYRDNGPPESSLSDKEILDRIASLDGTPREILNSPDMLALVLPALRADFGACDRYIAAPSKPFDSPISVFIGRSDRGIVRHHLGEWQRYTSLAVDVRMFAGGHFFIKESEAHVLNAVAEGLSGAGRRESHLASVWR